MPPKKPRTKSKPRKPKQGSVPRKRAVKSSGGKGISININMSRKTHTTGQRQQYKPVEHRQPSTVHVTSAAHHPPTIIHSDNHNAKILSLQDDVTKIRDMLTKHDASRPPPSPVSKSHAHAQSKATTKTQAATKNKAKTVNKFAPMMSDDGSDDSFFQFHPDLFGSPQPKEKAEQKAPHKSADSGSDDDQTPVDKHAIMNHKTGYVDKFYCPTCIDNILKKKPAFFTSDMGLRQHLKSKTHQRNNRR